MHKKQKQDNRINEETEIKAKGKENGEKINNIGQSYLYLLNLASC